MSAAALELHAITIGDIFQKKSRFLDWQSTSLTIFSILHDNYELKNQFTTSQTLIRAINGLFHIFF
jgi:hypothetical protein